MTNLSRTPEKGEFDLEARRNSAVGVWAIGLSKTCVSNPTQGFAAAEVPPVVVLVAIKDEGTGICRVNGVLGDELSVQLSDVVQKDFKNKAHQRKNSLTAFSNLENRLFAERNRNMRPTLIMIFQPNRERFANLQTVFCVSPSHAKFLQQSAKSRS